MHIVSGFVILEVAKSRTLERRIQRQRVLISARVRSDSLGCLEFQAVRTKDGPSVQCSLYSALNLVVPILSACARPRPLPPTLCHPPPQKTVYSQVPYQPILSTSQSADGILNPPGTLLVKTSPGSTRARSACSSATLLGP